MLEESYDIEKVKREINNLIWMYAPGGVTLEEAEKIACKMLAEFEELMYVNKMDTKIQDIETNNYYKGNTNRFA